MVPKTGNYTGEHKIDFMDNYHIEKVYNNF